MKYPSAKGVLHARVIDFGTFESFYGLAHGLGPTQLDFTTGFNGQFKVDLLAMRTAYETKRANV